MNFEKKIVDELKKNNLSDLSISTYIRNLKKLNDNNEIKNFKFLYNIDSVINKLDGLKKNTVKSYLISICSILKLFSDDDKVKKLYNKYYELMKSLSKEIESIPSDKMTEQQKNNWLSMDELKQKQKDLFIEVNKFKNKKSINEFEYNTLLNLLILSFYLEIPPRRNKDFLLLKVCKKCVKDINDNFNYIDFDNKQFIFNNFKTKKKEGTQTIEFNDTLNDILKLYLKFRLPITNNKLSDKNINIPLLVYYNGVPLWNKLNSITLILNKLFDKKIGSSMIRHIHNTYKFGDLINEQKDEAEKMAHSLSQSIKYIKDLDDLKK